MTCPVAPSTNPTSPDRPAGDGFSPDSPGAGSAGGGGGEGGDALGPGDSSTNSGSSDDLRSTGSTTSQSVQTTGGSSNRVRIIGSGDSAFRVTLSGRSDLTLGLVTVSLNHEVSNPALSASIGTSTTVRGALPANTYDVEQSLSVPAFDTDHSDIDELVVGGLTLTSAIFGAVGTYAAEVEASFDTFLNEVGLGDDATSVTLSTPEELALEEADIATTLVVGLVTPIFDAFELSLQADVVSITSALSRTLPPIVYGGWNSQYLALANYNLGVDCDRHTAFDVGYGDGWFGVECGGNDKLYLSFTPGLVLNERLVDWVRVFFILSYAWYFFHYVASKS